MTEVRWDLPPTWAWASMGMLADIVGGGTPSTADDANFAEHSIPWLTPADLTGYQDAYISRGRRDLSERGYRASAARIMPPGTVLFSSRAPIGYCAIAAGEISTNQGFKSFILKGEISPEYIRHYLLGSVDYAESKASGTTFKELSGSRAAELAVPLPPLPEQRRIVAKIDSLSGKSKRARDHLDHIPRLVGKYKLGVLSAAFKGDLTRQWRTQQGLVAKWQETSPAEHFDWSSGKNLPAKKQAAGTVPVIGGNGIGGHHNEALINFPTLVIGRVGAQCGNVHLSSGPAWITDNAIYARSFSEHVDLAFAVIFFRNANLNRLAGGSGQPYVNQSTLNTLALNLPTVEEQREIVRRVDHLMNWIDRLASDATGARRLIDRLEQAVLTKAFRGELVPQDAADEPASVLLERIKAGLFATQPGRRTRTVGLSAENSLRAKR